MNTHVSYWLGKAWNKTYMELWFKNHQTHTHYVIIYKVETGFSKGNDVPGLGAKHSGVLLYEYFSEPETRQSHDVDNLETSQGAYPVLVLLNYNAQKQEK